MSTRTPIAPGPVRAEPASDVLRVARHPLDPFFAPSSVALVGATEKAGSVGRTILTNLIASPFGGTVYPVNPKRPNVLGIRAYPSVESIPEPVELVVIVTPAPTVPDIVAECARVGVKAVIVISAGFKEAGPDGAELERRVLEEARRGGIRLIGPNCLGIMCPVSGLNATFASAMARPGRVAFISQSGALLTAILDWSLSENVGFSSVVSLGSMADVGWGDLIYYLGDDPSTDAILVYMETIGDARSFLSAAREVALTKPIIVMKPGRTEEAARAAASHTGSMTGSDEVLGTAFQRVGVLRVDRIADLFYMAETLAKQPRPRGPRLTIVTNAGGPGVLATDSLIGGGGELATLTTETTSALNALLPAAWSRGNPIDILGDAPPERYAGALQLAAADPGSDGLLVILTPQSMTDPTRTAQQLAPFARADGKPVLASWMGGADVEAGVAVLSDAGIPTFPYPDTAAQMFNYLWRYTDNLRSLYETPALPAGGEGAVDRRRAGAILDEARAAGRTLLSEAESKELLASYGIPITDTRVARTEEDAVEAAAAIGYPVVLKLISHSISHKTDVGGVQLNLKDEAAVRHAYQAIESAVTERRGREHFEAVSVQPMIEWAGYELIVGSSVDPQFGPVLLFGTGGQLVEVFQDRSLGLPPLTTTLARRMIEKTKIIHALRGVRGRPGVDLAALEDLLVRFSELVVEQPAIREIDINPLLASSERLIALDARVVLYDAQTPQDELPRPAIRPYPHQYVSSWEAEDGRRFVLRPIRPEDEPLMIDFHRSLSADTVYARYFQHLGLDERTAHERLVRICFTDYDREMALVAQVDEPAGASGEIAAVARLSKVHARNEAEFAIVVSDRYQRLGLGAELLNRLVGIAGSEGLDRLSAKMLARNAPMTRLTGKAGFTLSEPADGIVTGVLPLG